MAEINKKLVKYATEAKFEEHLAGVADKINPKSVVFIENTGRIWTHGKYYDGAWAGISGKPATFAPSAHTHGPITNDGKIGTLTNRIIETTTGGALTNVAKNTAYNRAFGTGKDQVAMGNHTHSNFTRTAAGFTPAPTTTTTTRYLREDGEWVVPPNTNTTYLTNTLAHLNAGTDTVGKLQTAKNLHEWLSGKGYITNNVSNINFHNIVPSSPKDNNRRFFNVAQYHTSGDVQGVIVIELPGYVASMEKLRISGWGYSKSWDIILSGYSGSSYNSWLYTGDATILGNPPFGTNDVQLAASETNSKFYVLLGTPSTVYGHYLSISVDAESYYSNSLSYTGWDIYVSPSEPPTTNKINPTTAIYGGEAQANKFIRKGGTSTQFLKADGSVDSNTYITASSIPSEIPISEIDAGTSATVRTITGRRVKHILDKKSDSNHNHTLKLIAGASTATVNSAADVANPYIRLFSDTVHQGSIRIVGGTNVGAVSKAGTITLTATDTTYTAGSNITINGSNVIAGNYPSLTKANLDTGTATTQSVATPQVLASWLSGKGYATESYVDGIEIGTVNLLRNSTWNDGFLSWSSSYSTILPPEPDKPNSSIRQLEHTHTGTNAGSPIYNTTRFYLEPKAGDSVLISFDYYCENANDNSVSSALITFRRSTAATGGTVTSLDSPSVSNLGLKNSAIDGKWVRATFKYTFSASNAVPAWYIFGLYMSNDQVGRTVRYKVREVMVVFGNIIPKSWTPAPEDQVSDWNVTDVNSFAFLKNKPTKLTLTGAVTGNTTLSSGELSLNTSLTAHTHTWTQITGTIPTWNQSTTGNAATASAVSTSAENTGTTSRYILFANNASGNQALKTNTGLKYVPSTNTISATFSGNLTGNVTGNASGSAGSTANWAGNTYTNSNITNEVYLMTSTNGTYWRRTLANRFSESGHTHNYLPLTGGILTGDIQYGTDTGNGSYFFGTTSSTNGYGSWMTQNIKKDNGVLVKPRGTLASKALTINHHKGMSLFVDNRTGLAHGVAAELTQVFNVSTAGVITAASFSGNINASSLNTGTVPNARITGTYTGLTNLTGTGNVDFARFIGNAGDTVAAPSITWTGDLNTGIYRPAATQVAITTGGVQRALFSSAGITGTLVGNASSATLASTLTINSSASASWFDILWNSGTTVYGSTGSKLRVQPSTGSITSGGTITASGGNSGEWNSAYSNMFSKNGSLLLADVQSTSANVGRKQGSYSVNHTGFSSHLVTFESSGSTRYLQLWKTNYGIGGDLRYRSSTDDNLASAWRTIWDSGNLANGTTSQYIRGDGSLATYANTTYTTGTLAHLNAGTDTTGRLQTAKLLNDWLNPKLNAKFDKTGGTLSGSLIINGDATSLSLTRTSSSNVNIRFEAMEGIVYAGKGKESDFVIGSAPDLGSNSNQWMKVNSSGVTAPTFIGALTGNASSASAVTLTADNTTNATRYPLFVDAATGNKSPRTDTGFTYNPSTGILTSTRFDGSGASLTALNATQLTTGTVPDARLAGVYTGFSHKINGTNTIFTSPSSGSDARGRTVFGLAEYRAHSSTATGAIVFIAPFTKASTIMKSIEIDGMIYSASNIIRIIINNYTSGLTKKMSYGTQDIAVRVGETADGNFCVILGDVATTWYYPHFTLSKAMFSHSSVADTSCYGWTTALVTSLTGYINISAEVANSPIVTDITGTATNLSRSVLAGNGLTGGGALTANRTLTLGTPGTITSSTTNSVGASSHTHALTITKADILNLGISEVGPQGPQGPKGDKPSHGWSGTSLRFENPNGTWGTYVNLKGDPGAAGTPGAPGAAGSNGTNGFTWRPSVSAAGALTWTNNGSTSTPTSVNIKGTPGAPGAPGAPGLTTSVKVNGSTYTQSSGQITLPSYVPVTGGTFTGSITATKVFRSSDIRLKDNICPIDTSKIDDIKLIEFNWKSDNKKDYGVRAQEVEKLYPELISTNTDGMKSVNYESLYAIKIARLEERIKELEDKLWQTN